MQLENAIYVRPSPQTNVLQSLLTLSCELTGMRAALVARKEAEDWHAYALHGCEEFGVATGDALAIDEASFTRNGDAWEYVFGDSIQHAPIRAASRRDRGLERGIYLLVPLAQIEGSVTAALCVFDGNANSLKPNLEVSLPIVANLIALQLRKDRQLQTMRTTLIKERVASQSREEFIAVLGHDLRSPLNGIKGAAELIALSDTANCHSEMIEVIRDSCAQISGLIDDILDFARGQLGAGIPISKGPPFDISLLAAATVAELRAAHPDRAIEISGSPCPAACVDEVRFRQLMSNLIGNAVQHSPPDTPVQVKLDQQDNEIRIAITNHGPSLSHQTLKSLFTPFARGSCAGKSSGLGLGLYIAAEIAKAHNGTIDASSTPSGITFTVRLPCSLD